MRKHRKLYDLLRSWVTNQLHEELMREAYVKLSAKHETLQPTLGGDVRRVRREVLGDVVSDHVPDEAGFETLVRDRMAAEYRRVRKVSIRHVDAEREFLPPVVTDEPAPHGPAALKPPDPEIVVECAGMAELAGYLRSPAVRGQLRRFARRAYNALQDGRRDTRKLLYVLLVLRESVDHYWFYGVDRKDLKPDDPRDGRERRPSFTLAKEAWVTDAEGVEGLDLEKSAWTEVQPKDSTSKSYLDLQGWDRPTSVGRQTQRYAFCPACADQGKEPWFLVDKKIAEARCTRCGGPEGSSTRPPKVPIQFVPRKFRRSGKEGFRYLVFYKVRGRWTNSATHEAASTHLNQRLDERWLAQFARPRAKVPVEQWLEKVCPEEWVEKAAR